MRVKMKHGGLPTQQIGASWSHGRPQKDFPEWTHLSPFLLFRTGAPHVAEAGPTLAQVLWPLSPKRAGLQACATIPDLERVCLVSIVIREGGSSSQLVVRVKPQMQAPQQRLRSHQPSAAASLAK